MSIESTIQGNVTRDTAEPLKRMDRVVTGVSLGDLLELNPILVGFGTELGIGISSKTSVDFFLLFGDDQVAAAVFRLVQEPVTALEQGFRALGSIPGDGADRHREIEGPAAGGDGR